MAEKPDRLSAPTLRKQPRRPFTPQELATLRLVADTLIPDSPAGIAGSAPAAFDRLIGQALAIYDAKFEMIEALLTELAPVPAIAMWDRLRELDRNRPSDFYVLSTLIVGAYLYSDEIKAKLGYPVPHRNPAGMFEIADELSSGILDPVIERGPIFVSAD